MVLKKALLVGINYKNTDNELYGCINDVNNIKNFLTTKCFYHNENIRMLTDDDEIKPTKNNILSSFDWLLENVVAGDILVFYFSGHGSFVRDANRDESDLRDEVIVPIDYMENGFILDDTIMSNLIRKVPANVTLWCFSDSCNSGTVVDLLYNYRSLCALKRGKNVINDKYVSSDWTDSFNFSLERSRDVVGNVYLFSGCRDIEYSIDAFLDNKNQGAFTFCLLQCLNNRLRTIDGNTRFVNGSLKLRSMLKEINCRLDIYKFSTQNSQLSMSRRNDIDRTFDL